MIKSVSTWSEAIRMAMKLSSEHAIKICDNIYPSDENFNGVVLHVTKDNKND